MPFDEQNINNGNRRDFLKKAAVMGLAAAAGGTVLSVPPQASAQMALPDKPIPRRTFGRSGIKVSTLSMGGMYDVLNNRLMLAKALEWGARLLGYRRIIWRRPQ